jgi:hypothetical protein
MANRRGRVSPALCAAIDAAEDLAWRPMSNLPRGVRYNERLASHQRLVEALGAVRGLSANASDELRYLVTAIRRAAAASYSNRMGQPYYERREAIYQLRGCLDVWKRSMAEAVDAAETTVAA